MSDYLFTPQHGEHIYEIVEPKSKAARSTPVAVCSHCIELNKITNNLKIKLLEREKELEKIKNELNESEIKKRT